MTKTMMSLILAGAALAAVPATAADRPSPEAQLAEALQGRTAGPPVDCVDLPRVRSTRIIPGTAILYDTGSTIYVNRPRSGGDQLNQWDTMVTRLNMPRLCSIDTVQMVDPSSHMLTGIVFLGDFVPYRRTAAN
jgi:hypothetical protein